MPIPDGHRALVEAHKVRDYLLNLNHPDGGSKAIWFHTLGYSRAAWPELLGDLQAIALHCDEFVVERTPFGLKYIVTAEIGHRFGSRLALVRTVWIVADDQPPRLVTAYPESKA